MNQAKIITDMYLVANLQDYGRPYVSLFIDRDTDMLYIFVRILEENVATTNYIFVHVTDAEISDYINRRKSLKAMFYGKACSIGHFDNGILIASPYDVNYSELPIVEEDSFDPEFCYDKVKVKVFLRKYRNGLQNSGFKTAVSAN